jgi:hypothetical protein
MLDDLALARDAGVARAQRTLGLVQTTYPTCRKKGLLRARFAMSKALGAGHQGREGGKPIEHLDTLPGYSKAWKRFDS